MMKRLILISCLALLLPSLGGVSAKSNVKNAPKYIVMIGFDGMSAKSIREGANMPCYRRMMAEGSYTLRRRSILPSSSACNWASLYMGAGPEQHGYHAWNSQRPDFPSDTLTNHGFFPDIFYLIRQQKPKAVTAHFYEWEGMHYVCDTLSLSYEKQVKMSDAADFQAVMDYVTKQKPVLTSIIFDSPDETGHKYGWESAEYRAQEEALDAQLAKIESVLRNAGMLNETLFILTADHGGKGKSHGGTTMDEMETCLAFCGKGVKSHWVIPEQTMIYDIPATIAYILDVKTPQAWIGRPIKSIFK